MKMKKTFNDICRLWAADTGWDSLTRRQRRRAVRLGLAALAVGVAATIADICLAAAPLALGAVWLALEARGAARSVTVEE